MSARCRLPETGADAEKKGLRQPAPTLGCHGRARYCGGCSSGFRSGFFSSAAGWRGGALRAWVSPGAG